MKEFNSIEDRALSEHLGSGLFTKKSNGKYSILLPVEGTGENGSSPAQLTKTAIGNKQTTSVAGRTENPQKTIPFYAHRDNIAILEKIKDVPQDFLRVLPDFTAMKYSGTVTYKLNNTDVGGLEQGEITITPTTSDEFVNNAFALIEDTVMVTNDIPSTLYVTVSAGDLEHTKVITFDMNPADTILSVTNESVSIATAQFGSTTDKNKLTVTGVAKGSTIATITMSKVDYAPFTRTILIICD